MFFFDNIDVSNSLFDEVDPERMDTISLLFQAGYLILKEKIDDSTWRIGYPNKEVCESLLAGIFSEYSGSNPSTARRQARLIAEFFSIDSLPQFFEAFSAHLAQIPYHLLKIRRENIFHALLYSVLAIAGIEVQAEVASARGRADIAVKHENVIYIVECKIHGSPEGALNQIKERGYHAPYKGIGVKIVGIGVFFPKETNDFSWKSEILYS